LSERPLLELPAADEGIEPELGDVEAAVGLCPLSANGLFLTGVNGM
jgi:hypothetical protein